MQLGKKETAFIIEQLTLRKYQLTEWEQGFLASIAAQGGDLTPKQQDTLSRIWDKN